MGDLRSDLAMGDPVPDGRVPLDRLPVEVIGVDAAPAASQRRPSALETLVRTSLEDA